MLNIEHRNNKIFNIIESTVSDFCKVLDLDYYREEESILVTHEGEDLFFIFPEFQKDRYYININCMVYSVLPTSKAAKLREIYRSEEVADYITEAGVALWFLDDKTLVTSHIIELNYSNYAILKSRLLLDAFINVQNARKLKNKLEGLLAEKERISVN